MTRAVRYQFMPPLSPEEYAELEESIRARGVMVPILRDANGTVVDGHHRLRIAQALGIDCPSEYLDERPEEELRTLAFELNLNRRHLTREQRRALVAESIKADPQLSSREHGRRAGVSHHTAESVRQSLAAAGQVAHLDETTGADGKTYPRNVGGDGRQRALPQPDTTAESVRQSLAARGEISHLDETTGADRQDLRINDQVGHLSTRVGVDGKTYPRPSPVPDPFNPADSTDSPEHDPMVQASSQSQAQPVVSPGEAPITEQPTPRVEPRGPLPVEAQKLSLDLARFTKRVHALHRDDRLSRHVDRLSYLRDDLRLHIEACQELMARIPRPTRLEETL
jgi:hypothetical protein